MLKDAFHYRYATKKFDPSADFDWQKFQDCLEIAQLSPSSYGLQPYRFLMIHDHESQEKLAAACYHQPQITTCSVLMVGQARTIVDEQWVDQYLQQIAQVRGVSLESLQPYRQMMIQMIVQHPQAATMHLSWSQKQLYLASGVFIAAAAEAKIDVCPMEGFQIEQLDRLLKTPSEYQSSILLAVGLRDQGDQAALWKKVRRPFQDLFVEVRV